MLKEIVLDLETQKSFEEVGGRSKNALLKISVAGVYDYSTDEYLTYEEHELGKLAPILQTADRIIGFNILGFDFQVIQPYLDFDIYKVPALDIMFEIEKVLGHRISLETVAQATLGKGKSGTGLQAITYWRAGRLDELKSYCLDDVRVTRKIYEYAKEKGKVKYTDFFQVKEIPLKISEAVPRGEVMFQGSLF
jgi:DEAD/DEAH box helicase domain-containing protein